MNQLSVEVENAGAILRTMKVKIPAGIVKNRFDRELAQVQKTAKIKGFRPGHVPATVVKQQFGEDIRHQLLHHLIDESFYEATREKKLRVVGRPKIDTGTHHHGPGDHDHSVHEDQDFGYTATFEVLPEFQVQGYKGLKVAREKVEVTDEDVSKVVGSIHQSQGQLVPVDGGLVMADGSSLSRPSQAGDFLDIQFKGGLVSDGVVQLKEEMSGQRVLEIGSNTFIPGFEDQLIGMRRAEVKTFRIHFPADYGQADFAGKEAEFTVTLNEIKKKNLPALDDEFAKQLGYDSLDHMKTMAKDYLVKERTSDEMNQAKTKLVSQLIEKHPFDVPAALVEGQVRNLAQEIALEFRKQGYKDEEIEPMLQKDLPALKAKAESQVRASLILEAVAEKESIAVGEAELNKEIEALAQASAGSLDRVLEYFEKNPGEKRELEFRLRQEKTVQFLLENAKA